MNLNTQEIRGSDSWNIETLKYIISNEPNDILLDNVYDLDLNFFNKNVKKIDMVYVLPDNFHDFLEKPVTSYFLILHLNPIKPGGREGGRGGGRGGYFCPW